MLGAPLSPLQGSANVCTETDPPTYSQQAGAAIGAPAVSPPWEHIGSELGGRNAGLLFFLSQLTPLGKQDVFLLHPTFRGRGRAQGPLNWTIWLGGGEASASLGRDPSGLGEPLCWSPKETPGLQTRLGRSALGLSLCCNGRLKTGSLG